MKTKFLAASFASVVVAVSAAWAADKEVTFTGEIQCAKCSLGVTESCQNALIVKSDGKQQVYFFAANAVNEKFGEVCTDTKKVKATGVVSEKDGKKIFTASKIEPVKS